VQQLPNPAIKVHFLRYVSLANPMWSMNLIVMRASCTGKYT